MSLKRKLKRYKGKNIDKDVSGLLCCLINAYALSKLNIHKMHIGYKLTCTPDMAVLPPQFTVASEAIAAYMEHENITDITVTGNEDNIKINVCK